MFATPCLLHAQDAAKSSPAPVTVEVDSITGAAKSSIPFDEPFILKIRMDRIPKLAFVLTTKGKQSGIQLLREEVRTLGLSPDCPQLSDDLKAAQKIVANELTLAQSCRDQLEGADNLQETKELFVEIDRHEKLAIEAQQKVDLLQESSFDMLCEWAIPSISPDRMSLSTEGGKKFVLISFTKEKHLVQPSRRISIIITEPMDEGFTVMEHWDEGRIGKAVELARSLWQDEQTKLDHPFSIPSEDLLADIYKTVKSDMDAIRAARIAMDLNPAKVRWPEFQAELAGLEGWALLDTLPSTEDCLFDCELLKSIVTLRALDQSALTLLMLGKRSLSNEKPIESVADRITALKATREVVHRMVRYQAVQKLLTNGAIPLDVPECLVQLDNVLVELGKVEKARSAVTKKMKVYFLKLSSVVGTTAIYDFNTRSAFRAIPDFGLIGYGGSGAFGRFTPYLGVQFNIRQSKKNIPWKYYPNKNWRHHLSFSLGYTLSKVAEEGRREDFFEKASLLTGVGWRLSDELRITAGGLWFYQNSPNPALKDRDLVATPFIGLSVDMDFAKLFNNLQTLIAK